MKNLSICSIVAFTLMGCGTKDKDENNASPVVQQPVASTNYPNSGTTSETTTPSSTTTATTSTPNNTTVAANQAFEDAETVDQSDYSLSDPYGVRYEPNAAVPYDNSYASGVSSQYNPEIDAYYNEMDSYDKRIAQPFSNYLPDFNRPYLNDRYNQHRGFLNYQPSFGRVQRGRGPWNNDRYDRMNHRFERSRRWINFDSYNLVNRTLTVLSSRGFRSPTRLEDRIRDAMRRRDHREMIRLHDALLDEARNYRGGPGNIGGGRGGIGGGRGGHR